MQRVGRSRFAPYNLEDANLGGFTGDPTRKVLKDKGRNSVQKRKTKQAPIGFWHRIPNTHWKPGLKESGRVYLNIFNYNREAPAAQRPRIYHVRPNKVVAKSKPVWEDNILWEGIPEKMPPDIALNPLRQPVFDENHHLTLVPVDSPVAWFRPQLDVLYLDNVFWGFFKKNISENLHYLLPGIEKHDLDRIQYLAVDAADMKDKYKIDDIFKTIRRLLPGLKQIWVMVTTVVERPANAERHDFVHIEADIGRRLARRDQIRLGLRSENQEAAKPLEDGVIGKNMSKHKGQDEGWTWDFKLLLYYLDGSKATHRKLLDDQEQGTVDLVKVYDGLKDGEMP